MTEKCSLCNGSGVVPTEQLELVKRVGDEFEWTPAGRRSIEALALDLLKRIGANIEAQAGKAYTRIDVTHPDRAAKLRAVSLMAQYLGKTCIVFANRPCGIPDPNADLGDHTHHFNALTGVLPRQADPVQELDKALMAFSVHVLGGNKVSEDVKQVWNELVASKWSAVQKSLPRDRRGDWVYNHYNTKASCSEQLELPFPMPVDFYVRTWVPFWWPFRWPTKHKRLSPKQDK